MSFLSSFGKRPQPKTQQVARPAVARPADSQKPPPPPSKAPSSGPRSRTDFLREEKVRKAPTPSPRKGGRLGAAVQLDRKRKSATPSTPQFDSDSDEEEHSLDDILHATKRAKKNGSARIDDKRRVRDADNWMKSDPSGQHIIHGAALTSGPHAKDFSSAFPTAGNEVASVELQYPNSSTPERFELMLPKKSDSYNPLRDIVDTMEQTLENFLPESDGKDYLDDMTGMPRRLRKALNAGDLDGYKQVIGEFNGAVVKARESGATQKLLDASRSVAFPLVERILDQVTVRTVSPQSEKLRQYESFSSNTYGELREEFNAQIFKDTELDSTCVFVDLGSGVGNVVLQAALQIGCESYGIEMMPNPCELAHDQAREFAARCRMWGISTGRVELLDGDFLEDARLGPILARADVILVNNELFSSDLNEKLRARFLDLKEGARVVSLKSFVPANWRLTERTSEDPCGVLEVKKKDYWSGCVSWTNQGGNYYVSTKDSSRIERILRGGR